MKLTTISVFLLACLSLKAAVETQYLQGLTSPVQANIDSRVLDTGDTMTGNLRWSGTTIPGLVPNNLTALQIGNLVAPPVASTVFNTTSGKLNMWDGSVWNELRIGTYVRTTGDTMTGPLVIGAGSVTASTPILNLTQTWNQGATLFEGVVIDVANSASLNTSRLFTAKTSGGEMFYVRRDGVVLTGSTLVLGGSGTLNVGPNADCILLREAAGILSLRVTGASAQTFNIYGTYTDASNYRRLRSTMSTGGAATISAEGLGTGVSGNTLALSQNGASVLSWDTSNNAAIAGDLQFATGSYVKWNGRTKIGGATDGILLLVNNAGSDFGRIQFGGTSATFPALKRNNTEIQARLADDSTFAPTQSLYERFGSGSPEGAVSAPVSTTYHRNDGGAGTSLYVKESGSGNTGWVAK